MSWEHIIKKDLTDEQKEVIDRYAESQDTITVRKAMQAVLKTLGFVKGSVGRRSVEKYLEENYPDKLE
tara:strand:+ start:405 stop:608 length:204 start_codon:yes stop_codon:yes gene_type:complete